MTKEKDLQCRASHFATAGGHESVCLEKMTIDIIEKRSYDFFHDLKFLLSIDIFNFQYFIITLYNPLCKALKKI